MLLAKPKVMNLMFSKEFETFEQCKEYLEQFTGEEMSIKEWIAIGKILQVNEDGSTSFPEYFYPKTIKVKGVKQTVMAKFDIEEFA